MSSALNTALYSRLAGTEVLTGRFLTAQQLIASSVGVDPDTLEPAVYAGNLNDAPIVLDSESVRTAAITFRPSSGNPDLRFRDGLTVDDGVYDLEVWTFVTMPNLAMQIAEAVATLIESRSGCPALPLGTGFESVWAEPFVSPSFNYDDSLNGWFVLTRYKFIEARSG